MIYNIEQTATTRASGESAVLRSNFSIPILSRSQCCVRRSTVRGGTAETFWFLVNNFLDCVVLAVLCLPRITR